MNLQQARRFYDHSDAVHNFEHVERVYHMAERLAQVEGADLDIVTAAALLHDVRGTKPGSPERDGHHIASAEFAAEALAAEGWQPERIAAVQHCIRAHRFRGNGEPPATLEAQVLFDADKLDVLGAVGVARVIAYAALADQPVYAEPSPRFKLTGEKEPGEPHSAYHEYLFKLNQIKHRLFTATGRALAASRDKYIAAFFQRLACELRGEC
ncbi:MAG: HD domain-containing protein [Anaerolineaceae bacterium]|nr:HD domain-containing protein [Anaerolineaceae bacterium]